MINLFMALRCFCARSHHCLRTSLTRSPPNMAIIFPHFWSRSACEVAANRQKKGQGRQPAAFELE